MSIKEFFQTIQWRATLQIAAIRIAIASILWPLLFLILGNTRAAELFPQVFAFLVLLTAFIAIAIPAIGLARANVPIVGLAALPAWLVVVADPFVKLLHAYRPDLVPVDEFNLINPPVLAVFGTGEPKESEDGLPAIRDEQLAPEQFFNESKPLGLFEEFNSNGDGTPQRRHHDNSDCHLDAQYIYEDGLRIFEEGDKEQGLIRVSEAIQIDPHHIDSNLLLASAFYHIDPINHAEQIFSTTNVVLEVAPENEKARRIIAGTHFAIGKQAWDAEDWAQATSSLIEAYRFDPTIEHLPGALAFCAEKGGALLDAIAAFEARLNDKPDDTEARQLAGRSYIKIAIDKEALATNMSREEALKRGELHLKAIIEHDPTNVDANYWLSPVYSMTRQDDKVKKIIEILRPISPEKAAEVEQEIT